MRNWSCFLAVDLGAASGRVAAARFDGERLTIEELHRFDNDPVNAGGHIHWDLSRLFDEVLVGIERAASRFGDALRSVGVATWGVDYVLLDENLEPIGDPHHYRDSRTDGIEDVVCRRVPRREIYDTTGIQFMFFNTSLQLYSEVQSGGDRLAPARRLLLMPDAFHFLLSGQALNERTIASTTQLLDARTGDWATGLMDRLGIPAGLFGELVPPGHIVGTLLPELRTRTGAPEISVVAPGSHDTASAVAAVPAEGEDHGYLSSGTWSLMGVELTDPILTEDALVAGFTNERGVADSVRFLKNISGLWILQECRRVWAEEGETLDYETITELAREAPPFTAFIDPDATRFAAPGDMPRRIRDFLSETGQAVPDAKGHIARIVLESLAMRYRSVHRELKRITGRGVTPLHVVGGGSQNALLNQLTADALGVPVVAGPVEATAIGNALVQMMALGEISGLDGARALVRRSFTTETFAPGDPAGWSDAHACFLEIEERP